MIFSRARGGGGRHKGTGADVTTGSDPANGTDPDERTSTARTVGPYDVGDSTPEVPHLDLGALRIPAAEGVEVRMQADNDGSIQQVVLVHGESALQLGAFAAPRTDGIWAEVRDEIRQQLAADGVTAEETEGEYGPQLQAKVRSPDGVTDIRFVGVDGPRWLVRAVFQGPAAIDPSAAQPLVDCLHGLVVDRGHEAMPVRDPLPLRLPREVAEQAAAEQAAAARPAGSDSAPAVRRAGG